MIWTGGCAMSDLAFHMRPEEFRRQGHAVVYWIAEYMERASQRLLVLEAMKMEHEIVAPTAGTVTELRVTAGAQVEAGAILAVIE